MSVNVRRVAVMRGWDWVIEGALIFSKSAMMWVSLLAALFVASRLLLLIPLIGVVLALITPNFIAGLAHGARAVEQGKPLRFGYLASGFLRSGATLVAIGGLSLAGQILIVLLMVQIGGDAFADISGAMMGGGAPPDDATQETMRAAAPSVVLAVLVGFVLLILLMMMTGFASLLAFFDGVGPLSAFALGLRACFKNLLPFLLYGVMLLTPILALMPLTVAVHQPDLGLWLMSPLLLPSLYASYKDVFAPAPAAAD